MEHPTALYDRKVQYRSYSIVSNGFGRGITNRTLRRENKKVTQEIVDKNLKSKEAQKPTDDKIKLIKNLLTEAGHEFVDFDPIQDLKPEAYEGLKARLRNLAHTPGGHETKTWLPWAGASPSISNIKRFLRKLPAPSWGEDLKQQSIDGLSIPSTQGMIKADGTYNKDLNQLLDPAKPLDLTEIDRRFYQIAMDRLVGEFKNWLAQSGDPVGYVRTEDGRIRLVPWTIEFYRSQMTNSINEASPGYPYLGLGWDDETDQGPTAFEESYRLGMLRCTEPNPNGFRFMQGARYTGDGGTAKLVGNGEGSQRLVQGAPTEEKLPGHMIALPLKGFFKSQPGSGQLGIQKVSRRLKDVAKGEAKPYSRGTNIVASNSWDVSKWDKAQTDEFTKFGFFKFCELVFDTNDEFTMNVLMNYQTGFFNRTLTTAMGSFNPGFLPSGASITTVVAFVHHTLILYVIDEMVKEETGQYLLTEYCLQGDDFAALVAIWNKRIEEIVVQTYAKYNCVIKGDMRVRFADDPDFSVTFLNEVINLAKDTPNYRFPRWNFWLAETFRDLKRGVSMDRMLLAEIRSRKAHPSPRELEVASILSKMDRFQHEDEKLPFYDQLLATVLTRCKSHYDLRSWLADNVMPTSYTVGVLRDIERTSGVNHPGDTIAAMDRQEETWLNAEELGHAIAILFAGCSQYDTKAEVRQFLQQSRNTKSWRRAGKILAGQIPESQTVNNQTFETTKEIVKSAFMRGYDRALEEQSSLDMADVMTYIRDLDHKEPTHKPDTVPMFANTVARSLLAANEADPFMVTCSLELLLIRIRKAYSWHERPAAERDRLEKACFALFHVTLSVLADCDEDIDSNTDEIVSFG